jgi:hypothetical protein
MSEPTANDPTHYEPPAIVRRDSIAGPLIGAAAPSDVVTTTTQGTVPPP